MPQSANVQIKLRRAFRYGYFAFLAIIAAMLALLAFWVMKNDAATLIPAGGTALMMAILVLALSVPLFFASWLVVSAAFLGNVQQRSLMDGVVHD